MVVGKQSLPVVLCILGQKPVLLPDLTENGLTPFISYCTPSKPNRFNGSNVWF